eukprot:941056-Pyramimonas_sp.AAC.1
MSPPSATHLPPPTGPRPARLTRRPSSGALERGDNRRGERAVRAATGGERQMANDRWRGSGR